MRGSMSLTAPNAKEKQWMARVKEFGCLICYNQGYPETPAVVHHLLSGGRRISHFHTIPLCEPGHHQYGDSLTPNLLNKISRHPWKARFEAAYGTEASLLAQLRALIAPSYRPALESVCGSCGAKFIGVSCPQQGCND